MSDKELRYIARELRFANLFKVMQFLYPETRPNKEELAKNLEQAATFIKDNAKALCGLE